MLMKAVRVHAFTQRPDDIRIDEVPLLEPAHGQIRVRMLMCPVHPSDFHYVRGIYYQALERVIWNQGRIAADPRVCFDPGRNNECPVPPYTLGAEGVGIVEASGGGFLAKHLVGKRVAVGGGGPPNGVWQEFAIVNARRRRADRIPARDLMMPLAQVSGFYLGNWMAQQSPLRLLGLLRAVKRLTAAGVFQADVSEVYPLEQVSAAVTASLKPGRTGNVLLRIGTI
jgi:hypothetical protein